MVGGSLVAVRGWCRPRWPEPRVIVRVGGPFHHGSKIKYYSATSPLLNEYIFNLDDILFYDIRITSIKDFSIPPTL